MSRCALLIFCVVLLVSCGSTQQPEATTPREPTGQAIYRILLQATKRFHVFTSQTEENLGITWADQLPRLEEEFNRTAGRADLLRAINHFANNLHNPHCYFKSPDRPSYRTPGFEIAVEWSRKKPRFYVAEVHDSALKERVHPGDTLVSYQGVDASDFLSTFHLESNGNHWRSVASDIARFFSKQSPHKNGPLSQAEWGFSRPGSTQVVTVRSAWREQKPPGFGGEFSIHYDPDSCAGLEERNYGGYRLTGVGSNYCIYTATEGQAKRYPIVRQFSFSYSSRNGFSSLKADHDNLKKSLGSLEEAKGVILDLRDNRGGNNPNWFLDWWAPRSYRSYLVFTRLHEDLNTVEKLRNITGFGPPDFAIYLDALAKRTKGAQFMAGRPFFCPTPDCKDWDNIYQPKNRVTELPVALLVGPRCASSCDSLVRTFLEYDFGPVVGLPGAAGLTFKRLQYQVRHPSTGEDLGSVALAFSYETSGKTGERLEGVVLNPHHVVDSTFENRHRYDALLAETAIASFGSFRFGEHP